MASVIKMIKLKFFSRIFNCCSNFRDINKLTESTTTTLISEAPKAPILSVKKDSTVTLLNRQQTTKNSASLVEKNPSATSTTRRDLSPTLAQENQAVKRQNQGGNSSKGLTRPREPDFVTAQRARPVKVKSSAELEEEVMAKMPKFTAIRLNKKILEAPTLPPIRRTTPRPPQFQEFHLETMVRASKSDIGSAALTESNSQKIFESNNKKQVTIPQDERTPPPQPPTTMERGAEKEMSFRSAKLHKELEEERARIPKANPYPYSTDFQVVPPKPEAKQCTSPEPFQLESLARHEMEMRREMQQRLRKDREEANMKIFKAQPVLKEDPIPFPQKERKPLTQVQEFNLHVMHRAVERSEFEKKGKEKEVAYKTYKEEKEAAKMMEETLVHHARPVPKFANPFMSQKYATKKERGRSKKVEVTKTPSGVPNGRGIYFGPNQRLHVNGLTRPREPDFVTAQRARPVRVKSSAELEEEVMAKMPKFRALRLDKKIFKAPTLPPMRRTTPRPPQFKEFHLETMERASKSDIGSAASTESNSQKLSISSASNHDNILRLTKPKPFQLHTEERGAEKEMRFRSAKVHKELEEERARVPKANPYPYSTDFQVVPPKPEAKQCTRPEPFQLESLVRHKMEMQREMQQMLRKEREEANMKIFKAQPILKEDPIPVPQKEKKPLTQVQEFNLHVVHRAVERSEFEKKLKEKEVAYKRYKEEKEAAKMMEEKMALKQLRRTLVHHARPVPKFANPFMPQKYATKKERGQPKKVEVTKTPSGVPNGRGIYFGPNQRLYVNPGQAGGTVLSQSSGAPGPSQPSLS